jgi:hypothetical protein
MSTKNSAIFTTPVGRIVWGSVYTPQTADKDGNPLVVKSGQNKGKPTKKWAFGLAITKTPGCAHFTQESWGQHFLAVAQRGFPNGAWQRPDFAWKVTDGDSAMPNKKGRAPNATPHNVGHWIISISTSMQAPRLFRQDQSQQWVQIVGEDDFVKCGHYVQVNLELTDNAPAESAGIYVNPRMIAWVAYGEEIISGPDVSEAGFGGVPLPAGASAVPIGGFATASPVVGLPASPGAQLPGLPGLNALPASVASYQPQQQAAPVTQGIPQLPIVPNPAFLQAGPVAALPGLTATPVKRMTAAAQGTYDQYIAAGYTDALLIQNGLMTVA